MRLLITVGVAVATLAVSGPRSFSLGEYVDVTSADGGAVAFSTYLSTSKQVCEHAVVWRPATGRVTYFRRPGQCRFYGDVNTVESVFLGGGRLVWTDFTRAERAPCVDMYTGTLADPRAVPVTGAPCGGFEKRSFDFAGRGNLIVFTSFFWCDEMDPKGCPSSGSPHGRYRVSLWRIAGSRAVHLTDLADRTDLLAVGDSRIAVRTADGAIDLYTASGRRDRTIAYDSGQVVSAWLDEGRLIVRTRAGLDLRAASSGRLLRTLSLPAAARVGDVRGDLAAYVLRSTIHVLRLTDARDRAYRTIRGTFGEVFNSSGAFHDSVTVGVVLDRSGLFYFYEADKGPRGRIVFVPNGVLQALLG